LAEAVSELAAADDAEARAADEAALQSLTQALAEAQRAVTQGAARIDARQQEAARYVAEIERAAAAAAENAQAQARARALLEDVDDAVPDLSPAAGEAQIRQTEGELEALSGNIDAVRNDQQRAAQTLAAAAAAAEEHRARAERASARAAASQQAWENALGASAFADSAAFEAAWHKREALSALRSQVQQHDSRGQQIARDLAALQEAIGAAPRPDLPALEQALSSARQQQDARQVALGRQRARSEQLRKARAALAELDRQRGELSARYGVVGELSEHANGRREQKVSLQSFVQGAVLDQVLSEASAKLLTMSRGQFQLIRRQASANRRSGFGLELDVADALTSEQRPVQSLSGGESFLAALALALSLSDVVRAFAGGVQIDTLFIDEGFGTLDPEALDRAMSELVALSRQGRMVGIISHVSELKERISAQVRLQRSDQGSTLRVML
ncbi:MAG: SbcC/MukB-like Walker B domain-containing protein, partial [Pseudomonadota bacterium]